MPYGTSRETVLKLTLRVIAQKRSCCDVLCAYSVKVVLILNLRVIAQNQSCGTLHVQRESSIEITFACDGTEIVVRRVVRIQR